MPPTTIVFDLDGTLIDTAPDLIATLNVVLSREKIPSVDPVVARTYIGQGARVTLQRGFAAAGRAISPERLDQLFADFLAYYTDHIADYSRPFPGLTQALDRLAADGLRLAVCTNKLEGLSVRLLDALDLSKRFAVICGPDTFGVSKPDPQALLKTIEAAKGHPGHAVMIGDSATDIRTAQAARIPVVAVDFGYSDAPVATFGPTRVISHFDELVGTLSAMARHKD